MRNTSKARKTNRNRKRPGKAPLPAILAGMLAILQAYAYGAGSFKITHRRADYFIVRPDSGGPIKIGSRGTIFAAGRETPAGVFRVIDKQGREYLCRIESLLPGVKGSPLDRVSFLPSHRLRLPLQDEETEGNAAGRTHLEIEGIRFSGLPADDRYYLSEKPLPLGRIIPPDVSGLKDTLFKIEKAAGNRYGAYLVDFDLISRWSLERRIDFSRKNTILLGMKEGKLGMIYEEGGILKHTSVSANTLEKFKESMYFFIVLKKGRHE